MGTVTKWVDDFMNEVFRNDRQHNRDIALWKLAHLNHRV